MMTIEQAKTTFLKERPELTIMKIVDWDKNHYVLSAVPDVNKRYLDPFYAVDKRNGKIYTFSAGSDIQKFVRLMGD